jgi:hypothetical protein
VGAVGLEAGAGQELRREQAPAVPGTVGGEGLDGTEPVPPGQFAGHRLHQHPAEAAATMLRCDMRRDQLDGVG